METELDKTLAELKAEILRAREKHPTNKMLVLALFEELGEMARLYLDAMTRGEELKPGNTETPHVACVVIRMLAEGSESVFGDCTAEFLQEFIRLGNEANARLKAAGVPD